MEAGWLKDLFTVQLLALIDCDFNLCDFVGNCRPPSYALRLYYTGLGG